MNFTFAHNNLNVYDLDASLRFYKEALGLTVTRTKEADDGSFKLVYLGDSTTPHKLELTWLRDMDRPYNLGDNEIHLAFETDDFDAAHEKHKEMECICFENPGMGIYFISDPDGYWLEIVPKIYNIKRAVFMIAENPAHRDAGFPIPKIYYTNYVRKEFSYGTLYIAPSAQSVNVSVNESFTEY